MRASSTSRRAAVRIFESASPRMRRAGSRITAATTTGPASGPRPASSTPAVSRGGRGSVMQGADTLENIVMVRVDQRFVLAVDVGPIAAFTQQGVGLKEHVLFHSGDIQDQRTAETQVERRKSI